MRTIEPWLREILRCPSCSGVLRDSTPERGPSAEPNPRPEAPVELQCPVCQLAYPVEDGIAVLLVDEASPLSVKE